MKTSKEIAELIDEYAKQKATDFEKWMVINGRKYSPRMSCEELYDEFNNK